MVSPCTASLGIQFPPEGQGSSGESFTTGPQTIPEEVSPLPALSACEEGWKVLGTPELLYLTGGGNLGRGCWAHNIVVRQTTAIIMVKIGFTWRSFPRL
jgi:hypothetical protein